ncbi:hypothetical protein NA57DRAFT_76375 [Rhizodiscina lignyota]|uniref:Extracellular serine-rich protein n=1 Tax=Rhizodiscina lignyota TaxID=1504668 RepID=A0A9P4IH18_9PEZI|nr:hypothetical protein NA57DRAFT_76375 [Rhizodiscina lignyota]
MVAITSFALVAAATLASAAPAYPSYGQPESATAVAQAEADSVFGNAVAEASAVADSASGSWHAPPSKTFNPFRATHRVIAGFNGMLRYEPENIVAEIGDLVEVHYLPKNHSFAQSSFQKPCVPINDDAKFSGFMPTKEGEAPNVFTIEIDSKEPQWYYCPQTVGSHCQMGMAMVINQNFNSPNTLDAYKAAANKTEVSISPPRVQGGTIAPPPNGPGL